MDAEDAEQEMKLAFLIAVHSMSYYNSEGECLSYIRNGLYRRFCALCRGNYQNSEEATEVSKLCEYGFTEKYDDVETLFDYEMLLANKPIVYSRIFRLLLAWYSDKEIGEILHCSKQYATSAAAILSIEPKWRSKALRRTSPMPLISSRTE